MREPKMIRNTSIDKALRTTIQIGMNMEEHAEINKFAYTKGKRLVTWAREVLLREAREEVSDHS